MCKKKEHGAAKPRRGIGLLFYLLAASVILAAVLLTRHEAPGSGPVPTKPAEQPTEQTADTEIRIEGLSETRFELAEGLVITDVAAYTGIYMEDGTDEPVTGVLMIVVTNEGDLPLQYAEITLRAGTETAEFALSTLPAGKSVVVLEKDRKPYDRAAEYGDAGLKNAVWFHEALSCCEEQLQIQALDGALNITNISGADLEGEIVIYYKNSSPDMFYGGITYRIRLSGGLPAGATKQVMADHFSGSGSTIVFVTCG